MFLNCVYNIYNGMDDDMYVHSYMAIYVMYVDKLNLPYHSEHLEYKWSFLNKSMLNKIAKSIWITIL